MAECFGFDPEAINISLYYPFLNLSSSMPCMAGTPDTGAACCGRECRACSFEVSHPAAREKLIVSGNTVFLRTPLGGALAPALLRRNRITRLVYCPFP
jgi:hypothetical protein